MTTKAKSRWRLLHWLEDGTLVCLVVILVGLSVTQIVLRNLGDSGLIWAENALRILVLWIAMFGAMRASREGQHITIDILARYFSGHTQLVICSVALLISALVCFIAAYYSLQLVLLEYEDRSLAFLSMPSWLCESIIPFALLIIACRLLLQSVTMVMQYDS